MLLRCTSAPSRRRLRPAPDGSAMCVRAYRIWVGRVSLLSWECVRSALGSSVKIMTKLLSTFGFFAGVALLALALLNPPSIGASQAREETSTACRTVQVPLDEGYGISQVESREICGSTQR